MAGRCMQPPPGDPKRQRPGRSHGTGGVQWHDLSAARRKELTAQTARAVRRAVLTLDALPDPDRRWLRRNLKSSLPTPVRDWHAYRIDEFEAPSPRPRFRPKPADRSNAVEVMGWLAWLERETGDGARDVGVLVARARGLPWHMLSAHFGRSDDTLRRWQDGAVATLARAFWRDVERLRWPGARD